MPEKTILILYGGASAEHEISCLSAANILLGLADTYPLELVGITRNKKWYRQNLATQLQNARNGNALNIDSSSQPLLIVPGKGIYVQEELLQCSCVFPVLHGSYGEDGAIQGLLECTGLPYVGADICSSAICCNKKQCKTLLRAQNLPIVPFLAIEYYNYTRNAATTLQQITTAFPFPMFIKPASAGSSVGITRVTDESMLKTAVEEAFRFDATILAEQGINAREIEVSVIGSYKPQVFFPGELISAHNFYSYQAKYLDPEGARIEIPAKLDAHTAELIQTLAEQAYRAVGCRGLARIDFFIEQENKKIYINEINTMPGFTPISMFPQMIAHSGTDLTTLLTKLIELACTANTEKNRLQYDYQWL